MRPRCSSPELTASASAQGSQTTQASRASKPNQTAAAASYSLGVYSGPVNVTGTRTFAAGSRRPVTYAMDFFNGASWSTMDHPQSILAAWFGKGYSMVWGVPMLPNKGGSLATGATGAYNQYFARLARAWSQRGRELRSSDWVGSSTASGSPGEPVAHAGQFVAYWRQIVTTMRSVPGADFTFEWNPSRGDLGAGNLAAFYPGNKFVDYVGLDVFDVEWQSYPGAKAEFAHIVTGPYGLNWLAAFSKRHNKPMVFPEWGLGWGQSDKGAAVTGSAAVGGGDDSVFITDMTRWFAAHRVFEATFWDFGSSSVAGTRNRSVRLAFGTIGTTRSRPAQQ